MQRSIILAELLEFEKPSVIDVFRIESEEDHQYDLPVYYTGQIIRTNFDYDTEPTLKPGGSSGDYWHLCI